MNFLDYYKKNVIVYDLINKFNYKTIKNIPTIDKIVLNFGFKNVDSKLLYTSFLALELITGKKGIFTQAKTPNILLKIRKGNPVGCKVILKKRLMYLFLNRLIIEIFPKMKPLNKILYKNKSLNTTAISFSITNILIFPEFEKNYYLFNNLPELDITFIMRTKTKQEFLFLLNSFKLPVFNKNTNCKRNSIGRV